MHEPIEPGNESEATWRALLEGTDRSLLKLRRFWRRLPASPRCKVCAAPFHGLGGVATKVIMHGRVRDNPLLCNMCFGSLAKHPGGAEVDISVLFADIRGSTALAERIGADAFRRLLQRFYEVASAAVERNGGVVDKLLGDGVMALFIPVIAGENHRLRAVEAGRRLLLDMGRSELAGAGAGVGAGVHSGASFVGVLGSGEKLDFSALGDPVNTAARLASLASPGELVVSAETWRGAGLPLTGLAVAVAEIRGREAMVEVIHVSGPALEDDDVFRPAMPAARIEA